jgi:hypothetical protein
MRRWVVVAVAVAALLIAWAATRSYDPYLVNATISNFTANMI